MVRLDSPLFSMEAHGWMGGYVFKHRFVNPTPYPIGMMSFLRYPYRMNKFNLRPYPGFISYWYSGMGWVYQRRRTWHGIGWAAIRPPVSVNKKSPYQVAQQTKMNLGVHAWHGFNQSEKDIYEKWRMPIHAAGYHRFLSWYMKLLTVTPIISNYLLLENGSKLKTEGNDYLTL
jgi:hypothetical protein